jgi:hypothetical protein
MCFPVDRDEILYPEGGINVVKILDPIETHKGEKCHLKSNSHVLTSCYLHTCNLLIVIGYYVLNRSAVMSYEWIYLLIFSFLPLDRFLKVVFRKSQCRASFRLRFSTRPLFLWNATRCVNHTWTWDLSFLVANAPKKPVWWTCEGLCSRLWTHYTILWYLGSHTLFAKGLN